MAYFVDTSALFKRYQPEKGTSIVCRILEATPQPVFISSIRLIEIISNLKRLYEVDKITTQAQFLQQRSFFYKASSKNNMYIFMIRKMHKPPLSPFRKGDEGGLLLW